jgi:hypothetical protein
MAQQTAVEWLVEKLRFPTNIRFTDDEIFSYKKFIEHAKEMEKQQRKNDITDYNIKVTEFLLNPSFNLEHSNHGIACEKLADIRNEFIKNK